jgi:serine/threonine protein kinase/tetratricopeptide (TPR) repeat protein
MPLTSGTRLGRYEVRTQIGAGGMGEVYLAQDVTLRRSVALKLLPAEFTKNEDRLRRFEQEACTASGLNHPNILTIHEIGSEGEAHFIATEFIDGESLRQHMTRAEIKLREMLDIVIQVASALTAAHEAGIVHRDIKPENIMVRRDGYVKVLDFGLAKLVERQAADSEAATMVNTDPGVVMGTASYMSPEQARGIDVDARTDIWSLGVVIYEMMAGRVPFEGTTTGDMIGSILGERNAPPLARFARDVPLELERIVTKALTKERDERYQSARDLLIDLKRLKQQLDVEAEIERTAAPEFRAGTTGVSGRSAAVETASPPTAVSTSNAEYIAGEIKRHKLGVGIAGVVLLAIIAGITYFGYFTRDSGPGRKAITSIAVLPLVNASNNPDADYLSDGISESLINSLSQLPQLKVIARSSSFKFKGKEVNPEEVAKALAVEAIVTGRVIQLGDQLQISAELVDTRDQTQLWGEQYTRKASDLLAVQAEISREIAERLRLKLTNTEQQQLAKRSTSNPEAYELLLKGRFFNNKVGGTAESMKAVEYYTQAITADPTYALAYAELATVYIALSVNSLLDPKEMMPKAQAAAQKALELDENLPQAHSALARVKQHAWDWTGAEREYKRAIELNPSSAGAHLRYSSLLSVTGRHEQALAEARLARQLDPLSPGINLRIGVALLYRREYDQSIEQLKNTLELNRNFINTHVWLGYAYAAKGQYAEAIAEYKEAVKLGEDSTSTPIYLGYALAMSGKRSEALAIRDEMQRTNKYISPAELAILYAGLGEKEQALAALERAYTARDLQLQFLNVEPHYDSLRSDPRFTDIVRRVGLPP